MLSKKQHNTKTSTIKEYPFKDGRPENRRTPQDTADHRRTLLKTAGHNSCTAGRCFLSRPTRPDRPRSMADSGVVAMGP